MFVSHTDWGIVPEIITFLGNFGLLNLSFIICKMIKMIVHRAVMRIM